MYCNHCGEKVHPSAHNCPSCGVVLKQLDNGANITYISNVKSQTAAGLWCFFLGGFGAHRFYLGQTGLGFLYLLFFWTGIPALVAIFDLFIIAFTESHDWDVRYNNQKLTEPVHPILKILALLFPLIVIGGILLAILIPSYESYVDKSKSQVEITTSPNDNVGSVQSGTDDYSEVDVRFDTRHHDENSESVIVDDSQSDSHDNYEIEQKMIAANKQNKFIKKQLNQLWNKQNSDVQQFLTPLQKSWLDQRDNTCLTEALEASVDRQDLVRINCETRLTKERIVEMKNIISRYKSGDYGTLESDSFEEIEDAASAAANAAAATADSEELIAEY